MALTPQWLDELRARTTLSTVIGRTTKLTRAGREWKACCPFHNEKSPSFTVSDEKGFYHCFGCGAHGDAIRWMTDQRGLGFMDAVQELAAEAGLEVPRPDPRAAQAAEQRSGLHEVMQAAQDWFVANLQGAGGARAREYLKGRGIDGHTIERFGFGFAPPERNAMKAALGQFDEALLVEAGLRIVAEQRENYDRFRDRLMLPIQDARGRVIAFGGRILDAEKKDAPKYLNSPDTPLFDKGRTLYNLHRASAASRQSGSVHVCEGYMDVIALAAAGIEDAVAPMGTAVTEQQIELLWRLADKPVLCLDGDAAGQRAAIRAATRALPLLRPGHSLQFATLPAGLDPDDLLRREGRAGLDKVLGAASSLLEVVWNHEQAALPLTGPEDKAGLKARLMAHVEAIAQPDIAALYRREWLDRFSALAFPRREKSDWQPRPQQPRGGKRPSFGKPAILPLLPGTAARLKRDGAARQDPLAAAVIAGLARHPDQVGRHMEALLRLAHADPVLAPLVDALLHLDDMSGGDTAVPALLDAGDAGPISGAGTILTPPGNAPFSFLQEGTDPVSAREDLAEAVALLAERPALEAAIAAVTARFDIDPEGAFAEQQRLRKRKLAFDVRLGQMAKKRAVDAAGDQVDTGDGQRSSPGAQETG